MVSHPKIFFYKVLVLQVDSQKHLGLILDYKLTFDIRIKSIMVKVNKTIGLVRKFQSVLPRASLVTVYKAFVRSHLDYGDIIFEQAFHDSFHEKIESVQYDAALAITGIIRGISKEKLYQKQGFESLKSKSWFPKLSLFYKLIKNETPSYLYNSIFKPYTRYSTGNSKNVALM